MLFMPMSGMCGSLRMTSMLLTLSSTERRGRFDDDSLDDRPRSAFTYTCVQFNIYTQHSSPGVTRQLDSATMHGRDTEVSIDKYNFSIISVSSFLLQKSFQNIFIVQNWTCYNIINCMEYINIHNNMYQIVLIYNMKHETGCVNLALDFGKIDFFGFV